MNLIEGDQRDGTLSSPGIRAKGALATYKGQIYLGFRTEDYHMTDNAEQLRSGVFGVESTGNMTYLTLRAGDKMI